MFTISSSGYQNALLRYSGSHPAEYTDRDRLVGEEPPVADTFRGDKRALRVHALEDRLEALVFPIVTEKIRKSGVLCLQSSAHGIKTVF